MNEIKEEIKKEDPNAAIKIKIRIFLSFSRLFYPFFTIFYPSRVFQWGRSSRQDRAERQTFIGPSALCPENGKRRSHYSVSLSSFFFKKNTCSF